MKLRSIAGGIRGGGNEQDERLDKARKLTKRAVPFVAVPAWEFSSKLDVMAQPWKPLNFMQERRNPKHRVLVALLLGALIAQALVTARTSAPTVDEVTFVASGYYMLRTHDFTFHGSNPALIEMLTALPLLPMNLTLPPHPTPYFRPGEYTLIKDWLYATDIYHLNQDKVEQITLAARSVVILLSVLLAVFVYRWATELYGPPAGLFALFLCVFSPNILGFSSIATLDIGPICFGFVAFYFFSRLLYNPGIGNLLMSGMTLGLALLTKSTGILIIPAYFLCALLVPKDTLGTWAVLKNRFSSEAKTGVASFVVSFAGALVLACLVLNLCYGFQGSFHPVGHYMAEFGRGHWLDSAERPFAWASPKIFVAKILVLFPLLRFIPLPLPASLVYVAVENFGHVSSGHNAFLLGHFSVHGWWYYFIVALFMKLPIPMLCFLLVALVAVVAGKSKVRTAELFLIVPIVAIFTGASVVRIDDGVRQVYPILPFVFVLVSRVVTLDWQPRRVLASVFALLCCWYVASAAWIGPHYLAYFNELVGGPNNGYRYLLDSNIDWGQDLKGLKKYMAKNHISKVKLSYFGSADPSWYGIDYEYLPSVGLRPATRGATWWFEEKQPESCAPTDGFIAVSVNNLEGLNLPSRNCFAWLRHYEPIAKIGYSIFIYEIPHRRQQPKPSTG